ncbi:hypothetical protein DSCA_19500 [Desulfosarcina alkanivorans]|uniref:histidine kinase n=1 Tax=Desulfosarcina alkanivorans TaxID=571177 RepID=A0A5K7YIT7_9BACT|nr:ATP-binding protein [Desulfosarcina alkanivorans]BBO68020.1 hypothetical protein DSCA_19500 [Desulfosarcina alkanivorans]
MKIAYFRNMLGVILGRAELAMHGMDQDHAFYETLEEIQNAAKRSADITRQLLAFARKQTIAPRKIDLNAIIEEMFSMMQRLIGENINMSWVPGENLWPVKIDPAQVHQVLANLCVNARDAIDGVGRVAIETKNIILDDTYCAMNEGFRPGEYAQLSISDDGCGMDRKTQSRIFEPFFTTKQLGKGTGLGLSTIYGIVKQNGGFINVYSEPGRGTTFRIYLARYLGPEEEKGGEQDIHMPISDGQETILVVEDEVSLLDVVSSVLINKGYAVLSASSPKDAIRLCDEHAGKIDMLITDLIMPEMNGRELSDELLSRWPGIKVLYLSGYTTNIISNHGILKEGVNFIQKPFSLNALLVAVRKALNEVAI